ncbi:MAG TPA: hypothetical protein VM574_02570 [Terrimicrobiaceae bacterium]|nr:hypothetical protein [Terrimicrobiaceae bacterium]
MLQAIAENEALLDKLSLLSSAESKRINVHSAEVDLVQSVRNGVARIANSPEKRSLTIETEGGEQSNRDRPAPLDSYVAQHSDFPFIVIAPQCPWNTWGRS